MRHLLEKEMVVNEVFLDFFAHAIERIEGALKVTIKLGACIDDSLHDLVAFVLRDAGAKWEILEVAADTDPSALDQSSLLS